MFVFDRFEPGAVYGVHRETLSADALRAWQEMFPDDPVGPAIPAGYISVVMMRAYFAVVTPRPPGNIHAGQRLVVHALPRLGDRIEISVRCARKEIRRDRRFVWLEFNATGSGGSSVFDAVMTSIVAE